MKKFRQVVLAAAAALVLVGLAPAPAAAQSYCDTLTTGLRLPKPNFNTPSWQFGGCIRNSFDILNSSVPLIGSTATFSQIWTSTISGLNASGLYISSYAVVGSSVYIMGHAQLGSSSTHVGVATFAATGAAVFSIGTSSGISLGGGGLRFADGTYQYTAGQNVINATNTWTGTNEWRGLSIFKSSVTAADDLAVLGDIALGANGGSPDFAIDMGPNATTSKRIALYSNGSGGAFYGFGLHGSGFVETWGNDNLITSAYGAGGTFGVGTAAGVAPTAMLQVNRTGGNIIEATNGSATVMALTTTALILKGTSTIITTSPSALSILGAGNYSSFTVTTGQVGLKTNGNGDGAGSPGEFGFFVNQNDALANRNETHGFHLYYSDNYRGGLRMNTNTWGILELYSKRVDILGQIVFRTGNDTEYMRLGTAGNLGINDASADARVDIVAAAADQYGLIVSSPSDAAAGYQLWVDKYGNVGSTTQPAARWTRTTALSINHDTNTVLKFLNKEYDTRSMFAVTHATIPAGGDGLYSVKAFAAFATGSSASNSVTNTLRRNLSVLKNGTVVTGCSDVKISVGGTDETRINVGCTLHLIATDAISVQVYQNEGSAQDVNSASFEIVKLW